MANPLAALLYFVGTVVTFGLLGTVMSGVTARTLSYSEFKQLVRNGEVATRGLGPGQSALAFGRSRAKIGRICAGGEPAPL